MSSDSDSEYGDEGFSDTDGAESRKEKFFCQHCPKYFTFPNNLKRHVEKFHTAGVPRVFYECHICNGKFQCDNHLTNHIRTVHEKMGRKQCKLCSKVFSNNNNLVQHMRYIHNAGSPMILFQCDYCKRQFNRKTNLEHHVAYTACNPSPIVRPTVQCQYCGRTMLKRHYRKHKCKKRKLDVNFTRTKQTRPSKKINQVFKTKEENEKLNVVSKQDCNLPVKVEAEDTCDLGNNIGEPSWAQFNRTKEENVRRSGRKRNKVEYRLLNGGDNSESESENQDSIEKSKQKREKKYQVPTESFLTQPVHNKESKSNEGFFSKYLEFLQPARGDDSARRIDPHGKDILNSSGNQSSKRSECLSKIRFGSLNESLDTNVSVDSVTETRCSVKEEITIEDHQIDDIMNISVKIEEFVDDIMQDGKKPS